MKMRDDPGSNDAKLDRKQAGDAVRQMLALVRKLGLYEHIGCVQQMSMLLATVCRDAVKEIALIDGGMDKDLAHRIVYGALACVLQADQVLNADLYT